MGEIQSIYLISAIAFVAVIVAIEGAYLLWRSMDIPAAIKVNRRLRELSATGVKHSEALSILRQRQFSHIPVINRMLMAIPRLHGLDHLLEQSGSHLTVSRFIALQVLSACICLLVFNVVLGLAMLFALPLSVLLGLMLPYGWISGRRTRRREEFARQLPDTLDFISRSLRAGNPLMATIKAVSENMAEPSASEFGITFNELNYGGELEEALHHLGERTGSEDIRFFITAVIIQRHTGGNLAEILNRISGIMRSRASTYREISILSSEMRASANVLVALPFIVAAAISIISPGYLNVLFETDFGLMLVGIQLIFMALGYWVVQKMIHFRV